MKDDPYPQSLPQQLRELGERWQVERLRGLYTTPTGRFVLYSMALVILLQVAAKISNHIIAGGWNFGAGYEFWLPSLLHSCRYATAQVGAIALVIWFQCRWPEQNRWGVFVGFAIGYALFLWVIGLLVFQRAAPFDSAPLWRIAQSLLQVATLLFFLRAGNVLVRLFLVDRSTSFSEQKLPAHNSWSLRGMFLVMVLTAIFLAMVRPTKGLWVPSDLASAPAFLLAFSWVNFYLELLMLWMLAYAVVARRIRQRRSIGWVAFVVAVAIPQLLTWMYSYFIWSSGPGRPPLHLAPLWINTLVGAFSVAFTMVLLKWFSLACERSGYQWAIWIRGSDDAIPTA